MPCSLWQSGFCAFVLNYGIGAGIAMLPAPLYDIGKALSAIRGRGRQWAIDPQQLFLFGFSSSAYTVALYSSVWHEKWLSQGMGLANEALKPNGIILGYPVLDLNEFQNRMAETFPEQSVVVEMMLTALLNTPSPSKEQFDRWHLLDKVSEKTAPTWIWTLSEDVLVHEETIEAYLGVLTKNRVSCQRTQHFGDVHGSGLHFGKDRVKRAMWFEKPLRVDR